MVDMLGFGFVALVYAIGMATGWMFRMIEDAAKKGGKDA